MVLVVYWTAANKRSSTVPAFPLGNSKTSAKQKHQRATINSGAGCRKWADSTLQQLLLPILVIY